MRLTLDGAATAALVIAALALAGVAVHRELGAAAPDIAAQHRLNGGPPVYVPDWETLAAGGRWVGSPNAPVKIVEFGDFECPFCKLLHDSLKTVRQVLRDSVAIAFVHYPLAMHRFALPAARAAECANAQGRFGPMADALYDKQDSLGLKSWVSYAAEAGVGDTARFERCARDTTRMPAVQRGLALGKRITVTGTPTVLVNGWRYPVTPYDSLMAAIVTARRGKP